MKSPVKYAILAALFLLVIAAAVRSCGSRSAQRNEAHQPAEPGVKRAPVQRESSGGLFGFFGEIFSSDSSGTPVDEEPEIDKDPPRLASELNIISEKLEEMEKLPEAVWYPNSTDKEDIEAHTASLRELFMLGRMVRDKTASREQSQRYIEIKMKILQEKIEMIRVTQDKAGEIGDRESGDSMTVHLEKEVAGLREALGKL